MDAESSSTPSREPNEIEKEAGSSASLEDDLDALIESCFTNSPALTMKPLPVPPSLTDAPATPLSLGDDEQFMAWLNDGSANTGLTLPAEITRASTSPPAKAPHEGDSILNRCLAHVSEHPSEAGQDVDHGSPVNVDSISAEKQTSEKVNSDENNENELSGFLSKFNRRLSVLKKESQTVFDQVSAVTREKALELSGKAAELAETASTIAAQKYAEYLEERAKQSAPAPAVKEATSHFTIDDEDEISGLNVEDEHVKRTADSSDPNKIHVSRTDLEKAYALAMHAVAGLRPGDTLTINKDTLPGATLFPCIMYASIAHSADAANPSEADESKATEESVSQRPSEPSEDLSMPEHRFLVVTKERFLVVDTKGGGVGSTGVVNINKHLTEVAVDTSFMCFD